MSTPSEQEAREALLGNLRRYAEIEHPNRDHPALTWKFDTDVEADIEMVDAYRTAILAAERARVRALVEGAPGYQRQGLFVSRADILQRLDAEPTP